MYSQAIASAQPRVRVMLFVIVFTEKVNTGSMEASSNVGGKVSSLDCALEKGRSKDTSADPVKQVHVLLGACFKLPLLHGFRLFLYIRNSLEGFCQYYYKTD